MDIKSAFFRINLIGLAITLAVGGYAYTSRIGADGSRDAALQAWANSGIETAPIDVEACAPGKSGMISPGESLDCSIQRQAESTYKYIMAAPAARSERKSLATK